MAADVRFILRSLTRFYDFADRSVIHVGAGGDGALIPAEAASVLAVDVDHEAVAQLREALARRQWRVIPAVVEADVLDLEARADVVLFEFCLHETAEPDRVLRHAHRLAPEICIIDHAPGSPWAWHVLESEKAARSWAAAERAGIAREQTLATPQRFASHAELVAKVAVMGPEAIARADAFAGRTDFSIEMRFRLALV